MSPARLRGASWLSVLLAGVVALALASRSGAQADVARALGWALLAAVGVSLLLGVLGRRLVAVLQGGLAVGLVLAAVDGEGHAALVAAGAVGLLGAGLQLATAHRWPTRASRYEREPRVAQHPQSDLEVWKAMDAGLDPTSDDFDGNVAGGQPVPRGVAADQTSPRPGAGADQKDVQ